MLPTLANLAAPVLGSDSRKKGNCQGDAEDEPGMAVDERKARQFAGCYQYEARDEQAAGPVRSFGYPLIREAGRDIDRHSSVNRFFKNHPNANSPRIPVLDSNFITISSEGRTPPTDSQDRIL